MKRFVKVTLLNLINAIICTGVFFFVADVNWRYLIYVTFATTVMTIVQVRINKYDGVLQIDKHNPEKDLYRLDLEIDFSALSNKKILILSIDKDADLSQK